MISQLYDMLSIVLNMFHFFIFYFNSYRSQLMDENIVSVKNFQYFKQLYYVSYQMNVPINLVVCNI